MTEVNKKSGVIAIIGAPNAGKSTLMNQLLEEKIAIMSPTVQTTRRKITGILSADEGQIIFLDTPGLHQTFTELNRRMMQHANEAIVDADLVLWLHDIAWYKEHFPKPLLELLQGISAPVVLVLNKIDTLKESGEILPIIDQMKDLHDWDSIIPISGLKGSNTNELLQYLWENLPQGPEFYPTDQLSTHSVRFLAAELVREQLFLQLKDELPHAAAVLIEEFREKTKKRKIYIRAVIMVERQSHKQIVLGKQGQQIKKIGSAARFSIEKLIGEPVFLELWVKVKTKWRDNQQIINELEQEI